MGKKLSIILPVYNVEPYIERCIESIENQDISLDDYEIIIVNDGTPDDSMRIVNRLQHQYGNIIVISKENGGLSSARNMGLCYASGDYVWFIDSDDYIDPNVLSAILTRAYYDDLDVLGFYNKDIYSDGRIFYPSTPKPSAPVDGLTFLSHYTLSVAAWSHIAKRSLYTDYGIRFTEGIYHEDYEYMLSLFEHCGRIAYMDICPYNYLIKIGGASITNTRNVAHLRKRLDSWMVIIRNLNEKYSDTADSTHYAHYAALWRNVYKYHALSALLMFPLPLKDKFEYVAKFKETGMFPVGETCGFNMRRRWIAKFYSSVLLYKLSLVLWHVLKE